MFQCVIHEMFRFLTLFSLVVIIENIQPTLVPISPSLSSLSFFSSDQTSDQTSSHQTITLASENIYYSIKISPLPPPSDIPPSSSTSPKTKRRNSPSSFRRKKLKDDNISKFKLKQNVKINKKILSFEPTNIHINENFIYATNNVEYELIEGEITSSFIPSITESGIKLDYDINEEGLFIENSSKVEDFEAGEKIDWNLREVKVFKVTSPIVAIHDKMIITLTHIYHNNVVVLKTNSECFNVCGEGWFCNGRIFWRLEGEEFRVSGSGDLKVR